MHLEASFEDFQILYTWPRPEDQYGLPHQIDVGLEQAPIGCGSNWPIADTFGTNAAHQSNHAIFKQRSGHASHDVISNQKIISAHT